MILEEETYKQFGYYPSDLKSKSHKRIIARCDKCEGIREISRSGYRSLCFACTHVGMWTGKKNPNWRGGKIKRTCKQCDKEFEIGQSEVKNGNGIFCSMACHGAWDAEHKKGKNSPAWKGGKIKRFCCFCRKEFYIYPSLTVNDQGKYCSRECSFKALSGEKSPKWKGGSTKCICEICGKEFEARPDKIKKGLAKYCSLSCARQAKVYPTHHTKPEQIFEQICQRNNLDFHYVGDGQLWIGKKGEKQLNPDFIEANGKKICVEIMGTYWHSPLVNRNLREGAIQLYREKHYKKYKWIPVFIWDTDLVREDAEAFVFKRITKRRCN